MDRSLCDIVATTSRPGANRTGASRFLFIGLGARAAERLRSFSVGTMLAIALLHVLPAALGAGVPPARLFAILLAGLLSFFVVEKIAVLRARPPRTDIEPTPTPDCTALQQLADGIMVAAGFLGNPGLGMLTVLAILARRMPQEADDFLASRQRGCLHKRRYRSGMLQSFIATLAGMAGFFAMDRSSGIAPCVLIFAAAAFLYAAVSHLMPRLQRDTAAGQVLPQFVLIGLGILGVALLLP